MNSDLSFDKYLMRSVSQKDLNAINVKLQNNIDSIMRVFNNIEDLIAESNNYFQGDFGEAFNNKYSEFQENFLRILDGLDSFRSDLVNINNIKDNK